MRGDRGDQVAIRDLDSVIRPEYFFARQEVTADGLRIDCGNGASLVVAGRREKLDYNEFKSWFLGASDDPLAVAWRDRGGSAIQLSLW